MCLKEQIEKIFMDNTNYINPSQAVNQASSLNALSSDLYTDSNRFIYELLQNADDSCQNGEVVKVWIKIFDDNLVVAHSGKPFTKRDLQGICNVNNGTKKSDLTKTGYKGIGFKSVFGQSDKVTIYTNYEYFKFDATHPFEWKWKESKVDWEESNDREFQFPWQIIPIYTEIKEISEPINQFIRNNNANVATIIQLKNVNETSQTIQNLSQNVNLFLFLKNICEIHFDIGGSKTIKIDRTKKNKVTLQKGDSSTKTEWLINTQQLTVPQDVREELQDERNIPEKLLNATSIELSLAAKVGKDGITNLSQQEKLLYSYLPTDETKYSLPVLVNTSFLTSANRESLHTDSKWNQWIFKTIAVEIFKWISVLVKTEFQFQAYQLIPEKTFNDELGKKFNEGIIEALKNIPFVISKKGQLLKIDDTIIDFTYLSEKKFIGDEPIKKFVEENKTKESAHSKQFAKSNHFFSDFKRLGASCFEWNDLQAFLSSKSFINTHTLDNNIKLIKHFRKLCTSEKVSYISENSLRNLPFIWDHKNFINYPSQVCFPAANDDNWNNPNNELSFVHEELQVWLLKDIDSRLWLEGLGLKEKTDITYITQNIIPNIDIYITKENALKAIRDLFSLYKKGDLKEELIKQLTRLKLLTSDGSLRPAKDCFLSNYYNPRLKSENILKSNIFVSEDYSTAPLEKDEWKRFFKMLGVQEGISTVVHSNKISNSQLIDADIKSGYFEDRDKRFTPYLSTFKADAYKNIITMNYLNHIEDNPEFSSIFWSDFIENHTPDELQLPAIAYWGHHGKQGQTTGSEVENYVPWVIKNIQCIPTLSKRCERSSDVFLNTKEIKDISGGYLPVFNGPDLSPDWKAFFNFKTNLNLEDFLDILSKISTDTDKNRNIKSGNYERVQSIYSILLDKCVNWDTDDIETIGKWSETNHLLNTKNEFTECSSLKYFLDGNESIFQEQYHFINFNAENRKNPNLKKLLTHFKIKLLKQNEFELVHTRTEECIDLKNKLSIIIPYLKVWVTSEDNDENTTISLNNLQNKIEELKIYQSENLKITYEGINFIKNVNNHFTESSLYVTSPWNANSVLLNLSEILCRYFQLAGHDKKLDFLLRTTKNEVLNYFEQEELEIPEEIFEVGDRALEKQKITSFADIETAVNEKEIPPEFFHLSKSDYDGLKYVESLISRSVSNVMDHLRELPEYDCSNYYKIADSIIGGITKNGNEITVVARPSDNNQVLIYYTSEFDVLDYVDAELWCEDGISIPKQITLGQLFKKTGINRIPLKNINFTESEIETLVSEIKSVELEFNAVPFVPQKTAKIISSFANANGGTLIFGLKEIMPASNEIVGISSDFQVVEITKRAISLLSPIPDVTFDWVKNGKNSIFVIKTEKANEDVLFEGQKYIRKGPQSVLEDKSSKTAHLSIPNYSRTLAVIIAIEEYSPRKENQISSVKYASNDANEFKDMLIKSIAVNESDIHMIINEDALKSNLEYDLKSLFYSLTEQDRLIFYYVGHGFHDGITNYLSTYDTHPYNITETAVSLRKLLLDPLLKSKCKNALVFIDACAKIFQNENERNNITDINDEEIILLTHDFPYYAMFLSCHPGESSYSSDILKNGIWTYHLVKAINGDALEALHEKKYLTDASLQGYLSKSVSAYTKQELGFNQNPKTILDSSHINVIVEAKQYHENSK